MADIHELANLLKELEEQLVVCIRCGMCQSVCPVFEQTKREADVARGKLALLDGLMTELFSNPDGVNERLNRCLLCGSCGANCPSGVNIIDIFIKARAIITGYKGLSPIKKVIFKQMLSTPDTFNRLTGWAQKFQGLLTKETQNTQSTSCARVITPLIGNRHFLALAEKPFCRQVPEFTKPSKSGGPKVLLFTGCLIDKIFPSIGQAAVKAMAHHGTPIIIPEGQGCCGIPALASGDQETFKKLVERHVDLFSSHKFDYLVTACATCTSTIKKLWPSIYNGKNSATIKTVRMIAEKTMDINQLMIDIIGVTAAQETSGSDKDTDTKQLVTYHDPCHLKKSLGVSDQPRALIRASGKKLIEMAAPDKCCGMGGSFNLFHYDISKKIGTLKQQNIADTGCRTVATGCPACMMQISDMLSKKGADIKARHPIELYADSI